MKEDTEEEEQEENEIEREIETEQDTEEEKEEAREKRERVLVCEVVSVTSCTALLLGFFLHNAMNRLALCHIHRGTEGDAFSVMVT